MRPFLILASLLVAAPLAAQTSAPPAGRPISNAGVPRAAAVVDSVYLDKLLPRAVVDGGDFTAYLMARLGVGALPPDFAFTVQMDSVLIRMGGRISDLPAEARRSLSQLVMMLPADSRLEAQISLHRAGPEAVRFHLQGATIRGIPVPDAFLGPVMASIGKQYPALTETGRDLFVRIPLGAGMTLSPLGVELTGPP